MIKFNDGSNWKIKRIKGAFNDVFEVAAHKCEMEFNIATIVPEKNPKIFFNGIQHTMGTIEKLYIICDLITTGTLSWALTYWTLKTGSPVLHFDIEAIKRCLQ